MNYTQSKDRLLSLIREGGKLDILSQVKLTALLSFPSMMAQMVHILMQYIDAGMVGSLGASASASIGLVSTSIWLFGSLCAAASVGFYVQCETKRKVSGQKMTLDKYSSKYFEKTSVRYVAVSATCETENNLEMREGDENVTINRVFAEWDGIGYNYITYSPQ